MSFSVVIAVSGKAYRALRRQDTQLQDREPNGPPRAGLWLEFTTGLILTGDLARSVNVQNNKKN